jgi:hypothetical protein
MPCSCCEPPISETTVINTSLASSQVIQDVIVLTADGTFTTTEIPADGGLFLVILDGVPQGLNADYTVDFDLGVCTIPGAVIGQTVIVIYVEA